MALTVFHGSDEFMIHREVDLQTKKAHKAGHSVHWESSSNEEAIGPLLGSSFFEERRTVVLFGDPGKLLPCSDLCDLMVVLSGEKLPSWAKGQRVVHHQSVPLYKKEEQCMEFAKQECKLLKLSVSEKLIVPLITTCGGERGLLSFELHKLKHFCQDQDPTLADLRSCSLGSLSGDVWGFMESLGRRDAVRIGKHLRLLGQEGGNVFRLLPLLGKNISQWLTASYLLSKGEGSRIPAVLELHPFVVKKSILPVASRWTERALLTLLRDLTRVGSKSKEGIVSPWILLQGVLLQSVIT